MYGSSSIYYFDIRYITLYETRCDEMKNEAEQKKHLKKKSSNSAKYMDI